MIVASVVVLHAQSGDPIAEKAPRGAAAGDQAWIKNGPAKRTIASPRADAHRAAAKIYFVLESMQPRRRRHSSINIALWNIFTLFEFGR